MDQQGPAAMLFNLVKTQLEGNEDLQQIENQVTASWTSLVEGLFLDGSWHG